MQLSKSAMQGDMHIFIYSERYEVLTKLPSHLSFFSFFYAHVYVASACMLHVRGRVCGLSARVRACTCVKHIQQKATMALTTAMTTAMTTTIISMAAIAT